MARGKALTDEEQDALRAAYAIPGSSFASAARSVGCSRDTARKYLSEIAGSDQPSTDQTLKNADDVARALLFALSPLIEHMSKPSVIAAANVKEAATAIGIAVDKYLLLTGKATSRTESLGVDPTKLTPEEREMAAKIRRKLAAEAGA